MKMLCFAVVCVFVLAGCAAPAAVPATELPASPPALPATPSLTLTATVAPSPTTTPSPTITPTATLGPGSSKTSPKDGMMLLYVPAGPFTMGSDTGDADEKPAHQVDLDAFWIDETEVATAMYQQCVQDGGCKKPAGASGSQIWVSPSITIYYDWKAEQFARFPIIEVSWEQADAYCKWAGRRLPTEAEWEKAARGTDGRMYPWGNQPPAGNMLNYEDNRDHPTDVGIYATPSPTPTPGSPTPTLSPAAAATAAAMPVNYNSPYGAVDMAGNVWEYVSDWYNRSYYAQSPASNPQGPASGYGRVVRGGSYANIAYLVRTTARAWFGESGRIIGYGTVGFRCATSQ